MKPSYKKYKELITERKVTSYRVGKETGINSTVFSDWKSGKSCPKVDKIKVIADYLGVNIECFYESSRVAEEP